jgi:hypothetical protein
MIPCLRYLICFFETLKKTQMPRCNTDWNARDLQSCLGTQPEKALDTVFLTLKNYSPCLTAFGVKILFFPGGAVNYRFG